MLDTTSEYVDKVVKGDAEGNNELGRRIADTLTAVPQVRPEVFDRVFNNSLQDLLMVSRVVAVGVVVVLSCLQYAEMYHVARLMRGLCRLVICPT
jgi:hypothetical protein